MRRPRLQQDPIEVASDAKQLMEATGDYAVVCSCFKLGMSQSSSCGYQPKSQECYRAGHQLEC